MKRCLIT